MCSHNHGECVAVPPTLACFAGIEDKDVFATQYLSTMRAYYNAVTATCLCASGCISGGDGDAAVSGGRSWGGASWYLGAVGESFGKDAGGVGHSSSVDNFVAGDTVTPGGGGSGAVGEGRSGSEQRIDSVDTHNDHVSCGNGVDAVSGKVRGRHYEKNKKRREKKRKTTDNRQFGTSVVDDDLPEWRRKGVGIHRGAFSSCTSEVQQELRDTRAKMLVERNKTALVRAEVERRKMEANLSSRTYELQVEAERLRLDAAREKVIADKLAKLPAGYAETVASEGLTSCVPSLSDGSVSPNSSISVAEVHRMMKSIADLTVRVAELTAQNQEDYVKKQAVIVQKDEELRAMEKKLAISDMKNRTNFGSEWASSSYDDDY